MLRPIPLALLIGLASWLLFVLRLAVPQQPVFDETHYVPAARMLLALSGPTNIEHPLLGKTLIAAGIWLFGDTPFGWRFFSTVAGAVTVVGVFGVVQAMFGRVRTSTLAAVLTLLNFTVFVQARIAMLDGYMAAFLLAGIACVAWAMRRGGWGLWLAGAALLGCAVGCKWAAVPYVGFAGFAFLWLKYEKPARWPGVPLILGGAAFGIVALASYFVTFAPAFFYTTDQMTLARLLPFQAEMYARQTETLPPHTYQSDWWTWPLLLRPIWYLYEPVDGAQRGILLLGNPAIMWGGLVAVAACLWGWIKRGATPLLAAAGLWIASVAIWAIIPKSLGFYYYYYPSSIFLGIAIAAAFDHWRARLLGWDIGFVVLAFGLALYFWPVLSAQALPDAGAFRHWTWLQSWV